MNNSDIQKSPIIEATLYDLKQIKRNLNPLSHTIEVIDNGSGEIIDSYFNSKKDLNRLIELIEEEVNS
jgi:hypothetical protein